MKLSIIGLLFATLISELSIKNSLQTWKNLIKCCGTLPKTENSPGLEQDEGSRSRRSYDAPRRTPNIHEELGEKRKFKKKCTEYKPGSSSSYINTTCAVDDHIASSIEKKYKGKSTMYDPESSSSYINTTYAADDQVAGNASLISHELAIKRTPPFDSDWSSKLIYASADSITHPNQASSYSGSIRKFNRYLAIGTSSSLASVSPSGKVQEPLRTPGPVVLHSPPKSPPKPSSSQ